MNSQLAERRKALVARSDQQRAQLITDFGAIENRLAAAEVVFAGVRRVYRFRFLVGAVGALVVLGRGTTRGWIRNALWLAPLALKGYRAMKSH